MYPSDLKYTETHEWVRKEKGGVVSVGITGFAVKSLSDIVFLELPGTGASLKKGAPFGAVESVKAVFDLNSPVTGRVLEVNDKLPENLDALKTDPYGEGWMLRVEMEEPGEIDGLMDEAKYREIAEE